MNIFDVMYEDFKFDKDKPIKLFEAFAGYGSQYMALKRLGVKVEIVGYSEIDKFAIQVYEALHGKHKNYGAIGSFDRLPPNIDICTWSFPCQDISLAGKQKGMKDGSRSNYGYVFLDTVEATPYEERPKVLLMENVRALFSEKFRDDWREIQLRLERMGYTNHADILNAKDYGVAQNRERVFIVSILGEYNYTFPKPIPLTKRLKDYLEDEVDEKYYLSAKTIDTFNFISVKTNNEESLVYKTKEEDMPRHRIYEVDSVGFTITTNESQQPSIIIPEATIKDTRNLKEKLADDLIKSGIVKGGEVINHSYSSSRFNRNRNPIESDDGIMPTLTTRPDTFGVVVNPLKNKTQYGWHFEQNVYDENGITRSLKSSQGSGNIPKVVDNLRIRKLTPREALRLMDVSESDIDIITSTVSNAQAYKLAGNSIVVSVLEAIFRQLIKEE